MYDSDARVTAVLGPTNTGKTHYAIERMLGHRTGVIGLPLRLLAREVYDRIVAIRGPSVVALVTGEERIVPERTQYWVCTVEAMPVGLGASFLAVDEIQLCADPDRGYVFTDRLLNARGTTETLFLGSNNMRGRIASLIPGVQFVGRERFSQLSYTGSRKISRMPPRSAIVAFSVDNVYAIAELLRRQKGGAAVVMGALSPRTRNAQVALYQNGDVDHLVATDAIGMGLNLDIGHVAFAGTSKFDGRGHRQLQPNELAQIAGRAGRYTTDGTFGVTGEAAPFDEDVVNAIENHRFSPLRRLQWRNDRLTFGTPDALISALEQPSGHEELIRAREADDLRTLKALWSLPAMRDRVQGGPDVRLLWDVCQVPDFRKVSHAEHDTLCERLYEFLHDGGRIPTDWLARQIARIDKTTGDIDTLSKRLAFVRTWTYVAQRKDWVDDTDHWRGESRAVEDRLSDALHDALTQRFVDRRTSVLMRRLKQKESLVAQLNDKGEVHVADQFVGRLQGFRFQLDPNAGVEEAKTLKSAALQALAPAYSLRADKFYNAPDPEIDLTEQGGLMWGEYAVGKLVTGADALSPEIEVFVDEEAGPDVAEKVRRRLGHWFDRKCAALFEPLLALRDDEALSGLARGVAFQLVEAMGVLPRGPVAQDVKALDQESRSMLRKHGVRFGQFTIFQPVLLKPAATRMRLVLWALWQKLDEFPEAPPPGLVTVPAVKGAPEGYYAHAGYRLSGERAIRIDMLERLADMLRNQNSRGGFEATADMLSITGLTLEQFADLMGGLGYKAERGERAKVTAKAATAADPAAAAPAATPAVEMADDQGAAVGALSPDGQASDPDGTPAPEAPATAPREDTADAAFGDPVETVEREEMPEASEKPVDTVMSESSEPAPVEDTAEATPDAPAEAGPEATTDVTAETEADTTPESPTEMEVFYTFTWAPPRRAGRPQPQRGKGGGKPGGGAKPRGKGPKGRGGVKPQGAQNHSAPPPRREKKIDPDNPFAALMALKDKK
ncbi:helicase-related protein [Oceanibium sediminis]|uniref:helicase-related protein n=1 Tax=Oceanibium sediminis TaxID=2026339 RepID=UPI000DD471F1|nr:helicase-related protein [Oceanibium sediminis]